MLKGTFCVRRLRLLNEKDEEETVPKTTRSIYYAYIYESQFIYSTWLAT